MKNITAKSILLVLYILLLSKIMGFKLWAILDLPFFIMVLSGALLISLLTFQRGSGKRSFLLKTKWAVLISGCLITFLSNVSFLSAGIGDIQKIYNSIVHNFLPMFYAFFLYFILDLLLEQVVKEEVIEEIGEAEADSEKLSDYDLTRREMAVAREILGNLSNSGIGEKLFISENTVKKHINHIFQKVGVRNRTEFIVKFHSKKPD